MTDTLAPVPILRPLDVTVTEVHDGHYLRAQKTSHFPRRYVFFDTEAHRTQNGAGEDQTWRLGVTGTVYWRERTRTWAPVTLARHETPESLWELVTAFARKDQSTVVVAHKLGYDLRISNAFALLPQMGWSVTKVALSGEHVGLDLRKGSLSLVLVDSLTVITHGLNTVGSWKEDPKPDLPADDAPLDTWWERCEADVKLLTWAYMEVVRWMSDNDLGGWARSGSGLGWHALIRNHLHEKVLVHNDPELLDIEGQSCYSARTEAFKIGKFRGGPSPSGTTRRLTLTFVPPKACPHVIWASLVAEASAEWWKASRFTATSCTLELKLTCPCSPGVTFTVCAGPWGPSVVGGGNGSFTLRRKPERK